jgi:segregation and condensation protein B
MGRDRKNIEVDVEIDEESELDAAEAKIDPSAVEEEEILEKDDAYYSAMFESLVFLSSEPVPLSFFVKSFGIDETSAKIILDTLMDEYNERGGGIKLVEVSNGYQFVTNPKYASGIRKILGFKKKEPLSKGMLETLAIVAYKQPVVLAEIEELRGVSSRMMLSNLMKKNLIKPVGRKELPGRPLAYGTTDEFLRLFGLNRLADLPKLSEIKEFSFDDEE